MADEWIPIKPQPLKPAAQADEWVPIHPQAVKPAAEPADDWVPIKPQALKPAPREPVDAVNAAQSFVASLSKPSAPDDAVGLPEDKGPGKAALPPKQAATVVDVTDRPKVDDRVALMHPGDLLSRAQGALLGPFGDTQLTRMAKAGIAAYNAEPGILDNVPVIGRDDKEQQRDKDAAKRAMATLNSPETATLPKFVDTSGKQFKPTWNHIIADYENEHRVPSFWEHPAAAAGKLSNNVAEGLGSLVLGLAEIGNELVGVSRVPEDVSPAEHAVAWGEKFGASTPAQIAAMGRKLASWDGSNALLADPVNTVFTFLPALELAGKARPHVKPLADATAAQLRTRVVEPAIDQAFARFPAAAEATAQAFETLRDAGHAVGETVQDFRASFKRSMLDGIFQRDSRWYKLLEDMTHNPEHNAHTIAGLAEQMMRLIQQDKVHPSAPELQRTTLNAVPAVDEVAQARAVRVAEKADAATGQAGGRLDAALELSDEARAHQKAVESLQRRAGRAEERIAEAAKSPLLPQSDIMSGNPGIYEGFRGGPPEFHPGDEMRAPVVFMTDLRSYAERYATEPGEILRHLRAKIERPFVVTPETSGELARLTAEAYGTPKDVAKIHDWINKYGVSYVPVELRNLLLERGYDAIALPHDLNMPDTGKIMIVLDQSKVVDAPSPASIARKTKDEAIGRSARARAATAAQAGIQVAEAAKQLDAAPAAGMAREVASMQRGPARAAERAAAAAAEDAATTGVRPQVQAGDVWLPAEKAPGGSLTLADDAAGIPVQRQSIRDHLPEVREDVAQAFDKAAASAADAKTVALDAGFPEALADEGRRFADDLVGRHVDDTPAVLAARLEQLGAKKGTAAAGADWLLKEVELGQQAKRIEVAYGRIRTPTPEVKQYQIGPDGVVVEMPASAKAGMERALSGEELPAPGPARRAAQEAMEMQDRTLEPEAPRAYRTDNPRFDELAKQMAEKVRESYYPHEREPGSMVSDTPPNLDDPTAMQKWTQQADQHQKMLSDERLQQRMIEHLEPDTTQLLRSDSYRRASLQEFGRKLRADMGARSEWSAIGKQFYRNAMDGFAKIMADPARVSDISKNRFPVVKGPTGNIIWDRGDMARMHELIPVKRMRRIQADAFAAWASDIAQATQAYGMIKNMSAEVFRFYTAPDGTMNTDMLANPHGFGLELAKRVLVDGEAPPAMMPYPGAKVAAGLAESATAIAEKLGITPDAVTGLAERLNRMVPAAELQHGLNSLWNKTFKSTDAPTPGFGAVHIDPVFAGGLKTFIDTMQGVQALGGLPKFIHALGNRAKTSVVAESVRALVNNNLSNFLLNMVRRGDPGMIVKAVHHARAYRRVLNNDIVGMDPADVVMYRSLAEVNPKQRTTMSRDVDKSSLWASMGETVNRGGARLDAISGGRLSRAGEIIGTPSHLLREAYTDLGDMVFRIEDMANSYRDRIAKTRALAEGEHLKLQVTPASWLLVERMPGDTVRMTDISGPSAKRQAVASVSIDSPAYARKLARAADVIQNRAFFDLGRTGNVAKVMRSGSLNLISGIFSWFFQSVTIPGVTRGLVGEMLEGVADVPTNSPAVQAMQLKERMNLRFRVGMIIQAGQAALADQKQMENLRRAMSYEPGVAGALLSESSNPMNIEVRQAGPLVFTSATSTVAGGFGSLLNWMAFRNVMDDPAEIERMLDPDAVAMREAIQGNAAWSDIPTAVRDMKLRREAFRRYVLGDGWSWQQALGLVGLGGGPLLSVLDRLKTAEGGGRKFTPSDAIREFGKQMVGASVYSVADTAAAMAGMAGWDTGFKLSSYGDAMARSGQRLGGAEPTDESGMLRWGIRQLIGTGWTSVVAEKGLNEANDHKTRGRVLLYLSACKDKLKEGMLLPLEKAELGAKQLAAAKPSPEHDAALKSLQDRKAMVARIIDSEIEGMAASLRTEKAVLHNAAGHVPSPGNR